jgi:hypothetical protein
MATITMTREEIQRSSDATCSQNRTRGRHPIPSRRAAPVLVHNLVTSSSGQVNVQYYRLPTASGGPLTNCWQPTGHRALRRRLRRPRFVIGIHFYQAEQGDLEQRSGGLSSVVERSQPPRSIPSNGLILLWQTKKEIQF